jgi:hypothetical protein
MVELKALHLVLNKVESLAVLMDKMRDKMMGATLDSKMEYYWGGR